MIKENEALDPAAVLRVLSDATASLDAARTPAGRLAMPKRTAHDETPSLMYSIDERDEAMRDFEVVAMCEAIAALGDEIDAFCRQKLQQLYEDALEVYYAAEELARDPANAHLLPHLEAMRSAHEAEHGPIPPRRTH